MILGGAPREDNKGIEIGMQIHVRFLYTHEALNRRAVKHALVVECFFELAAGYRDILERAENIGKLQADKADIFFVRYPQYIFLCVFHKRPPFGHFNVAAGTAADFHYISFFTIVKACRSAII